MPRTLRVAGTDMIPAPTMLDETLNTAPEIEEDPEISFSGGCDLGRSAVVAIESLLISGLMTEFGGVGVIVMGV